MRILLTTMCLIISSSAFADGCVTNLRGQTVCGNSDKAVAVNPNTGTVTTAQRHVNGVTTTQNSNGSKAAYNPNTGTVTTAQKYANGATTGQNSNGSKAVYNPRTGNAAVAKTNPNGVTTTQTSRGGEAKTKNGVGVVEAPNGTVCAKGRNNQGCTKP